jgi:hypothetical protein
MNIMKKLSSLVIFLCFSYFNPAWSAGTYADWTVDSGNNGSGTFGGQFGMPDFTFTLKDDLEVTKTQIDDDDVFDNTAWEAIFGEADNQESLRFGSQDKGSIAVSNLTIRFSVLVNIQGTWAFAVTDLEGEDVIIGASLKGTPILSAEIASWFQGLMDTQPATSGSPHLPSGFDSANTAVVAEFDADGLLSRELFSGKIKGTESASAWFIPDVPIDTLTISHKNRYNDGNVSSMHLYIAASDYRRSEK